MILKRFQLVFTIFEIIFTCSSDLTCGSTTSPKDLKSLTSSISSFLDLILKSLCELCFTTFPDRDTHSKFSFFSFKFSKRWLYSSLCWTSSKYTGWVSAAWPGDLAGTYITHNHSKRLHVSEFSLEFLRCVSPCACCKDKPSSRQEWRGWILLPNQEQFHDG